MLRRSLLYGKHSLWHQEKGYLFCNHVHYYLNQLYGEHWFSCAHIGYCKYEVSNYGRIRNEKFYIFRIGERINCGNYVLLRRSKNISKWVRIPKLLLKTVDILPNILNSKLRSTHLTKHIHYDGLMNLEWLTPSDAGKLKYHGKNKIKVKLTTKNEDIIIFNSLIETRKYIAVHFKKKISQATLVNWCKKKVILKNSDWNIMIWHFPKNQQNT